MTDKCKNKTPEEKNEIREKEKNKFDQVSPWTQKVIVGTDVVTAAVGVTSAALRTIKNGDLQYDLDRNKCPQETKKKEEPKEHILDKFEKSMPNLEDLGKTAYAGFKEGLDVKKLPDCLKDEFNQFFNYVPLQYYIAKMVADSASTLTNFSINELRDDPDAPCKEANNEIIDNILNVRDNYIPTSIPMTIPRIPLIRTNSWDKLLLFPVFAVLCRVFTEIINNLKEVVTEIIISLLSNIESSLLETNQTLIADRYSDFGLKKVNLNKYISKEIIISATTENLLTEQADLLSKVRQYFDKIQEDDDILQRQILLLLIGEVECSIINQLINKNKEINIGLDTEKKIILFFKFLGEQINMIGLIENSKDLECIPDYCVEITQKAEQDIKNAIDTYCKLLNPKIEEALKQFTFEDFFKDIGLKEHLDRFDNYDQVESEESKDKESEKTLKEIIENKHKESKMTMQKIIVDNYPSTRDKKFLYNFAEEKSELSKYKKNDSFDEYFYSGQAGTGGNLPAKDGGFSAHIKTKYDDTKIQFFEKKPTPIFQTEEPISPILKKVINRIFIIYYFYYIQKNRVKIFLEMVRI